MGTTADRMIAALRSGHDELAVRVAAMSPADLARPSGCREWDVSQVLSHIGSGAEIGLAALAAAIGGGPAPDGDFNRAVWARWDAASREQRARDAVTANAAFVERFESLTATQRDTLRIDLGWTPEPIDVATDARFRLSEFALHGWDVAVAFDPKATLAPEATPLLLDHTGYLLSFVAEPEALDGAKASLAVSLTDPASSFGLTLGPSVSLGDVPASPDGFLRLPAEAWFRLVTGRLGPGHTPAEVSLTGPLSLDDLRRVFPGF